jgi:murein DD-endopeptidase MepM/ murein hydrolase activator NlpD
MAMGSKRRKWMYVCAVLLGVIGLCLVVGLLNRRRLWRAVTRPGLPPIATAPPYTPWPTPPAVQTLDFPLQPPQRYGPYAQGITGPRAIDTRFGAQNPALGTRRNCFRDSGGNPVPFHNLHHAGVDLFAVNQSGGIAWGEATHAPVHAVADGVVAATLDAGAEGQILITEHRLAEGDTVYSVYWHVERVQVRLGQPVSQGQVIARIHDQGLNSHLHWEIRTFVDGTNLFPAGTAGARGTCNGHVAGVGYTWDDEPRRANPVFYGYADPIAFVIEHQP